VWRRERVGSTSVEAVGEDLAAVGEVHGMDLATVSEARGVDPTVVGEVVSVEWIRRRIVRSAVWTQWLSARHWWRTWWRSMRIL
jgi:hypothetical protein